MTAQQIHALELEYGLTKTEILDAIDRRFRAKVTLEGAVAEVHLGKHLHSLVDAGSLTRYETHDQDGYPDYSIWLASTQESPIRIECKNVRNSDEAYRSHGEIIAYKVETQKTRASKGDKSSRFYGYEQFEILAVCLGKKTHDWTMFMFIESCNLAKHRRFKNKMAVMHRVPLPGIEISPPWYDSLTNLINGMKGR
jgi:hypothetical protein